MICRFLILGTLLSVLLLACAILWGDECVRAGVEENQPIVGRWDSTKQAVTTWGDGCLRLEFARDGKLPSETAPAEETQSPTRHSMAATLAAEQKPQPPGEQDALPAGHAKAKPGVIEPPLPFEGTRFMEHVEYLAADELRGRDPGTEGSKKAADHIIEQYRLSGLQPLGDDGTFVQVFPWKDESGRNLVAFYRGAGDLAEQAIVVSAHYDHLGTDQKLEEGGQDGIYNGADDNASGVAALLLIVEALGTSTRPPVSPRRSVVFIAFDCEERGLAGSRYYCQHPRWPLHQTMAVINLDMVGRLRSKQVYAGDIASSPLLTNKLETLTASHDLLAETRLSGIGSDHRAFLNNGIPALNLGTGTHSDRHRVSDEAEGINSAGGARVAWLAYSLLADLVSSAEPIPFQPPDSQFDVNLLFRVARGLGIVPSPAGTDEGYAKILMVLPGSAAAKAGVQSGDQVTGLNGHTFQRIEDILTVWSKLDLSEGLKLSLLRGDEKLDATISSEVLHDLLEGESTRQGGDQ